MPQEKLNLLQLSTRTVAQACSYGANRVGRACRSLYAVHISSRHTRQHFELLLRPRQRHPSEPTETTSPPECEQQKSKRRDPFTQGGMGTVARVGLCPRGRQSPNDLPAVEPGLILA